jgi:hypothetical protein
VAAGHADAIANACWRENAMTLADLRGDREELEGIVPHQRAPFWPAWKYRPPEVPNTAELAGGHAIIAPECKRTLAPQPGPMAALRGATT